MIMNCIQISGRSLLIAMLVINVSCYSQADQSKDPYMQARYSMVQSQIKARGIDDPAVIDAMLKVERHRFVPEVNIQQAYEDYPLPIGEGQTISQPYIVAFMTQALDLRKDEKVLEVGTGSGYQAAVLAELCDSVFSIELLSPLADRARLILKELGYENVWVKVGDGYKGWPEHAPFDGIVVTCSPTHIPKPLEDQLAEGGRMIIPVGHAYSQELVLLEKKDGKLQQRNVLPVRFVPMMKPSGKKY